MRRSRGPQYDILEKPQVRGWGGEYEDVKGERGSIVSHLSEFEFPIF